MLGIGYFWKLQKLIPSKEHQSFLIAKICSCKTQNIADLQKIKSRKNFVPHGSIKNKIVDLYDCFVSFKFDMYLHLIRYYTFWISLSSTQYTKSYHAGQIFFLSETDSIIWNIYRLAIV